MGYLKSDRKIENPFLWACLLSYGLTQPNSPRRAEWPTAKVYSDRLQKCTLQFIILGSKINGVFFFLNQPRPGRLAHTRVYSRTTIPYDHVSMSLSQLALRSTMMANLSVPQ